MNSTKKFLIPLLSFSFLVSCGVFRAYSYTVDEKLKLEQTFEQRTNDILENILGRGKVVTYVDISFETTQIQSQKETYNLGDSGSKGAKGAGAAASSSNKKWLWDDNSTPQKSILPGYPVKDAGGAGAAGGGGAGSGYTPPPAKYERISEQKFNVPQLNIKKMIVTLLVDQKLKEETLQNVPSLVATILNLSRERGDNIIIQRIPFPPPPSFIEQFRKPEMILDISKFTVISALTFFAIVTFLLIIRIFLRDFSQIARAINLRVTQEVSSLKSHAEGAGGASGRTELPEGAKPALQAAGAAPLPPATPAALPGGEERHFQFISESNLNRLSFMLMNETPDKIAVTLSYLNPKDTARILSTLPPEKRTDVTYRLSRIFESEPQDVVEWEKTIEKKINYVLGGSELMSEVLDMADDKTREALLADIATRDPKAAEDLRNGLFLFENIVSLDDKEMKILLSKLDNEQLAVALQGAPEALITKIFSNKAQGAQQILKETMDLMGKQHANRITSMRQHIVRVVRQLIKEGFITPKTVRRIDAYVVEDNNNR